MKLFKGKNARKISIIALSAVMAIAVCFGVVAFTSTAQSVNAESAITTAGWASYHGLTSVEFKDGAMQLNSTTNPGSVYFTDRTFGNYEMEVEMQLNSGNWFGLMYRSNGAQKGFYQLGSGSGGYHQLKRHETKSSGSGWDEVNIIKANSGYSSYTMGTRVSVYLKLQDNKLTLKTKMAGESEYFTEFENTAIPTDYLGEYEGFIGFCLQYSDVTVYSVKINDLDSEYQYVSDFEARSKKQAEWGVIRGAVTPTQAAGVTTIAPTANPTVYGITNIDFTDYVMEAEFEFNKNWAGLCFRVNGAYKGFFNANTSQTYFSFHETKSGDGWGTGVAPTVTDYTKYTYGSKMRLRVTVLNNHITAESKIIGTDSDYVKIFDNVDVSTLYSGKLGTSGGVGLVSRTGTTMKVYDFKVTDSLTGVTYYLPTEENATWGVIRGTVTPTQANGVTTLAPTANPTVYGITNVNFTDYVMESEFEFNKNWAGLCFRVNGAYKGFFNANTSKTYFSFHETKSGDGWGTGVDSTVTDYTKYTYGSRMSLRVTVLNNHITAESKIIGTDSDYVKIFDNVDISTLYSGKLGTSGGVGLVSRTGTTMKVYDFKVTDLQSGRVYDIYPKEEQSYEDSAVFDGDKAIDTSRPLTEIPTTTEIWFKSSELKQQTLMTNSRSVENNNCFILNLLADGRLSFKENNGGGYTDFSLTSKNSYADGEWHKAVIRRDYNAVTGMLTVDLSVYTNGNLVDKCAQTYALDSAMKEEYAKTGVFYSERFLQIGTYRETEDLFVGEIAEIRMWNRVLSDSEVSSIRLPLVGDESGLIHDFLPSSTGFVDKVTVGTTEEVIANFYEVWLDDYVIGDADWRIAVLPDIQFIVEGFEINMIEYFEWIRDNAERLNIKLVLSVGDMVNTCTPEQMAVISEASAIIDGVVPFMPLMGNHDYPSYGRDTVLWNEYFPYAKYSKLDCFGGAYEEGRMDNYYYLMNINGSDYMFMGLELAVRPAVAEWANEVIAAHPNHKVIIVNHAYMDANFGELMLPGESGCPTNYKTDDGMTAVALWETLISQHSNVQLVLCGHMNVHKVLRLQKTGINGNVVHSLLFDNSQIERHYGGLNMVGLLGFTDGSNTLQVNSYSIERGQYYLSCNQFEIELDWEQEYRITFKDGRGNIISDKALKAGEVIELPNAPANYSDGVNEYTFSGWNGYTEGMTATQNLTFTANYQVAETQDVKALSASEIQSGVEQAKQLLFAGSASAYVKVANNVSSITKVKLLKEFALTDTITVFGEELSVIYLENGSLFIHVLALELANECVINGNTVISLGAVFEEGQSEVYLTSDIHRSYYDHLLNSWMVALYKDDAIALTLSDAEDYAIVEENGEYILINSSDYFGAKVAVYELIAGDYEKNLKVITQNRIANISLNVSTVEESSIDGDLSDWSSEILKTGRTMVGLDDTAHKQVTYYAYLTDEGLYVGARAEHDSLITAASEWFNTTNFEFFVNGDSCRFWISAYAPLTHEAVQGKIVTVRNEEGESVWLSYAEGFIPMEKLPTNALSGELNIGFAWKTPGDNIKYHNMTSGYDWWYPTRRHASESVEQYFVTAFGLVSYSTARTVNGIQLDGNFDDFNTEAKAHNIECYSTDGSVGYTLCAHYIVDSGIYVGIDAKHKTNPHPDNNYTWYNNTNFEFYIGSNRYYVTCAGAAGGKGLFGKNTYLAQSYDESAQLWNTKIELFIPVSALATANSGDFVRMAFAFKPTGEKATFEGFSASSDFWHLADRAPSNLETQFYVYECGISTTEAVVLNTPEKCTDMLQVAYTNAKGEQFIVEYIPQNRDELHAYGSLVTVTSPTCTAKGEGYIECAHCGDKIAQEIDALGHTAGETVVENRVEATCESAGSYDNVVYCSVCGKELARETVIIDALGHTAGETVVENRVEATCESAGSYDNVVYCSVCDKELARETVIIDALGHTAGETVVENRVEATCESAGSYDNVVYCSVCNKELSRNTVVIKKLPHTAGETVVENRVEATCESAGSYDNVVYCSVCDKELAREAVAIEKLPHTEVVDDAVAPTCTESGLTEGKHCSVCNAVIIAQEVIDPLGHDMSESTCAQPGTCKNGCGLISSETVEHLYGDWEVVKPATHNEEGIKVKVCSNCGHTVEESFKQNGAEFMVGCNGSLSGGGLGLIFIALSGIVFIKKRRNK